MAPNLNQHQLTKSDIALCEPTRLMDIWVAEGLGWPTIGPNQAYATFKPKHDGVITYGPEIFTTGILPRRWSPSQSLQDAQHILGVTTRSTKESWDLGIYSNGYMARFSFDGGRERAWYKGDYEAHSLFSIEHAICQAFLFSLIPPK
jgi:hypothetical protein